MTKRFWLLIGCLYVLLLVGIASLQGEIIVLMLPLLAYLGAASLFAPRSTHLHAGRDLNIQIVQQNQPINVHVWLESQGAAADELYIEDDLPTSLQALEGETRKRLPLAEAEKIDYEYTIISPRGNQSFQSINIQLSEHFALLERRLDLPTPTNFQSVPETTKLGKVDIRPIQTRGFSGPIPARQSGSGMSFWGVRQYQLGDARRRINWKISARQAILFTNQFEQERIADVGLILDARQQTDLAAGEKALFEHSVSATAALAEAFLDAGHRVSLLTYGLGMQRVYPGYGKIQRQLILRSLAQAESGSNYALESLDRLPTRLFPAGSQLVMITPLTPRDYSAFVRLRKDGYEILLVSPNPISFEMQSYQENSAQFPELSHAVRLARLERSLLLRRLLRLGVQIVDWTVDQPLEIALRTTLNQPFARRNLKVMAK